MTLTPKYQFVKPGINDYVNIDDLNGNMDKVEEALASKADLENGTVPLSQQEEGAQK